MLSSIASHLRLVGLIAFAPAFLSAFVLTAVLVKVTIHVCHKHGWVARPRTDRWHMGTPAAFGGVPMWAAFIIVSAIFLPFSEQISWKLVGISSLVFCLGLIDDIFHLRPRQKLLAQLFAAALVVSCGLVYPLRGIWLIDAAVSLVWIVGITNAFNLLDNMDGLSAGVALISAFYLVVFYVTTGSHGYALLVSLTAGVIGGFLLFNLNPARIFMGDGGSLFIGFLLGTASLLDVTHISGVPALVFAPAVVLAIPILDTFFVSVTRRLRGRPVSVGGTDHSSHRLVRLGLNERNAVLLLYALTAGSGAVALGAHYLLYPRAIGLVAFWFLFLFLFGIHLFHADASNDPHNGPTPWPFLRRLQNQETLAFLLDPVVLSLSYFVAYYLRFWDYVPDSDIAVFLHSWPIVLITKFACLFFCRVYRHSWWRGSISDFYRLGQASLIGEISVVLLLLGFYRFRGYSRAVFLLDCVVSWCLLFGVRKSFGLFREVVYSWGSPVSSQRRVFVLGTSQRAELALRFLRGQRIECAGLIDTNGGGDLGRYVWGARVVGRLDDVVQLADRYGVSEIILPEDEPILYSAAEFNDLCRRDRLRFTMLGLYSANSDGTTDKVRLA